MDHAVSVILSPAGFDAGCVDDEGFHEFADEPFQKPKLEKLQQRLPTDSYSSSVQCSVSFFIIIIIIIIRY